MAENKKKSLESDTSKPEKSRVKYVDTLDNVSRCRYVDKLRSVNGIDPYENTEWSEDVAKLPSVEQDDISDYLVHRTSYYTRKRFKAQKQLGAHNQMTSGWVKKLFIHKPQGCENSIITSEVYHSQSLSVKPLKPWVIAEPDGTVITAHCDCMAGIAETCSHIAAVLFAVDASVRLRDSKTVTQVPAGWVVPPTKDVMYSATAADINFASAAAKKRRLDQAIEGTPVQNKGKRKPAQVPMASMEEMGTLFDAIQFKKTGVKPGILSLIPRFASDYRPPQAAVTELPKFLKELEDEEFVEKNYKDVLQYCQQIDIIVTPEQAILAEQTTREQANSKTWMRLRTGRVTASKAHQVVHTNPAQPSLSLIQNICRPENRKETAAMRWGIDNEKNALNVYRQYMERKHRQFHLNNCGLFINPEFPYLGASPDGIRFCECHGKGCVEVKCPASKAACTVAECCSDPNFFLAASDEALHLKKTHPYYTQVQVQLFVTETEFCDFVVWTKRDFVVITVYTDIDFWQEILPKMKHIFFTALLPELVGNVFSRARPHPQPLQLSPTRQGHTVQPLQKLYCYCKRSEEEDDMIACDNENCNIEWFHFFCVGMKTEPKGRWYCPDCRQLPEFRRTGKAQPKTKK